MNNVNIVSNTNPSYKRDNYHSELVSESYHPAPTLQIQVRRLITKKYLCAFTLAEVLITLVIIGVISAISVPILNATYQKDLTVTRLKKAYSTISQTTNRAIFDNGPIKTWEVGASHSQDDMIIFLKKYILPYLISINLKKSDTSKENDFYFLNGDKSNWGSLDAVQFYLNDGTKIISRIADEDMISVFVDINGNKLPNKFGRDIFQFRYVVRSNVRNAGKLIPYGQGNTRESILSGSDNVNCNKTTRGQFCSALIFMDGWRIADDYPW